MNNIGKMESWAFASRKVNSLFTLYHYNAFNISKCVFIKWRGYLIIFI